MGKMKEQEEQEEQEQEQEEQEEEEEQQQQGLQWWIYILQKLNSTTQLKLTQKLWLKKLKNMFQLNFRPLANSACGLNTVLANVNVACITAFIVIFPYVRNVVMVYFSGMVCDVY